MKRFFSVVLVAVLLAASPAVAAPDAATLTGQILDSTTGDPIAGAKVLLAREGQDRTASNPTAADGSFALEGVDPATYHVGVERDGKVFVVDTPLALAPGQTRNVQLAVQGNVSMAPAVNSPLWQGLIYGGAAIGLGWALNEWTSDDDASPTDPELTD